MSEEAADQPARRILMLCTKFARCPQDRYLTNDLAHALRDAGAIVDVAVIDWTCASPQVELISMSDGIRALFVPPPAFASFGPVIAKVVKWLGAGFRLRRAIRRVFADQSYDLVLGFSPLVTTGIATSWAISRHRCRGYAYIVDFFPWHHHALGLLNRGSMIVGLVLETLFIRRFDVVACMSDAGVRYLKKHYFLRKRQKTPVLHLWGDPSPLPRKDRKKVRIAHAIPTTAKIALFGGQLAPGRGIEDILAVAGISIYAKPDLYFLFVGSGGLEALISNYIDKVGSNVIHIPAVSRDAYLQIAMSCDVGLISTVANSGVPTFPSKVIDYLRAGLPVIASVESSTDFGSYVEQAGFGKHVPAGDANRYFSAICEVVDSAIIRRDMCLSGYRALRDGFDVEAAAAAVLAEI